MISRNLCLYSWSETEGRLQPGLALGDVPVKFGLYREQNWYFSVLGRRICSNR